MSDLDSQKKKEDLAREYRVTFVGELDRENWPERHRLTFEDIQNLSNKKFDVYASDSDINSEPWRAEAIRIASAIKVQAERSEQRNEASWRFACEPVLLDRISSEVCCQNCRKRLWRSEIEVSQDRTGHAAADLRRRQKAREPCRCPRMARSRDSLEASGLNKIFHYRIDEEVHHEKKIRAELGKGEKPDRIYGLRQTRNIEDLLFGQAAQQVQGTIGHSTKQVHELLDIDQPLTQTGDRLLFPFLVLEAKSGIAGKSWHDIRMQTAFPILTLLDTQERLRKAAGPRSKWRSGPLVWFLANKGEDWRVSVCFTEAVTRQPQAIEYRIVDVWQGSITTRDGSLQLLLIVDYIFDWARDKYRNDIIEELRVLASGDHDTASTLHVDSDIYSTVQFDPRNYLDDQSFGVGDVETVTAMREAFNYNSPKGVARHAAFVESKFNGIMLTKETVQRLLDLNGRSKVLDLCDDITILLSRSGMTVEAATIDDMEWHWTGTRHAAWTYRHQRQPPYFVSLHFCTYLDENWHIVRELTVIAATLDAWDELATNCSKRGRENMLDPPTRCSINSDTLVGEVNRLLAGSPGQVLLSAINRVSKTISADQGIDDVTTVHLPHSHARGIFQFIYSSATHGGRKPEECFMRSSERLGQQNLVGNGTGDPFLINPNVSDAGCVLLTGTCIPGKVRRNYCVFFTTCDVAQKLGGRDLARKIKAAYETCDVYHTTRNHGFEPGKNPLPNIAINGEANEDVWNLEGTYGVHTQSFGFLEFVKKLGGAPPTTQGSTRVSAESGSQLYDRNFSPWQDLRHSNKYKEPCKFILYKLFSQEIGYWRSVAKKRRAEGIECCECCAAVVFMDICPACQSVLFDPNRYTWMKRCMTGEAPFELTPFELTPFGTGERKSSPVSDFDYWSRRLERCKGAADGLDDDDWALLLESYPRLDEPFENVQQLESQWEDFQTYCRDTKIEGRKRKRVRDESDESALLLDALRARLTSRFPDGVSENPIIIS